MKDTLLPNEIRNSLKTRIFGQKEMYHFTTAVSTNDIAGDLGRRGAPEGTLVIAETQTGGKGRMGRTWHSPPGTGIYLSIILRPGIVPAGANKITLMTAVAAAEAVKKFCPDGLMIKWPNDILINGKKAAGILTTMDTSGDSVHYVIVGIGINVNAGPESFPGDLRDIATSLFMETGMPVRREILVREFLESFECFYRILLEGDFRVIREIWKEQSNIMGKEVTAEVRDCTVSGKAVDLDDEGFLLVRDAAGGLHRIISGDIIKIH